MLKLSLVSGLSSSNKVMLFVLIQHLISTGPSVLRLPNSISADSNFSHGFSEVSKNVENDRFLTQNRLQSTITIRSRYNKDYNGLF